MRSRVVALIVAVQVFFAVALVVFALVLVSVSSDGGERDRKIDALRKDLTSTKTQLSQAKASAATATANAAAADRRSAALAAQVAALTAACCRPGVTLASVTQTAAPRPQPAPSASPRSTPRSTPRPSRSPTSPARPPSPSPTCVRVVVSVCR